MSKPVLRVDEILLFESVRAENLPFPDTKTLGDRFSFLGTKTGVCIDRGHQNRGVLVVFGLLGRESVDIDVYVACHGDMFGVIDQYDFAGQMPALSFINLKMEFFKIEKAYLREGGGQIFYIIPRSGDLFGIDRRVGRKNFADVDIWLV